ncbi:MAG: twin-arginine translocation signal domain-containing protein [Myxococcales bacterium]
MALTRRSFIVGVPALAGAALGCSSGQEERAAAGRDAVLFSTHSSKPGSKSILVCMPETRQTSEVWRGLSDELSHELELIALRIGGEDASATIARGIERYRPAGLVLMNNPTVDGYRRVQASAQQTAFPPSVIVMSSFLEGKPAHLRAATGISYEVPLITVVTNLRKLIATTIDRIGVVHRSSLSGFVRRQAALAHREQTAVVREEVSQKPNASEIKRALRRLKQRCDAIWVLNDDRLLTPRLLADGWLHGLNEPPWVPTIVGAASLVSPSQSFGTFAVLPDHTALGTQAANLVLDIAENDWQLPSAAAQLPLSTTTTVDLTQAKERFLLRPSALAQVDKVLER